jgi:hypothetical protein
MLHTPFFTNDRLSGHEVADLLRRTVRGEAEVKLPYPERNWEGVRGGQVVFEIEGYEVVIFNDAGRVDYVDYAASPDGRACDFEDWYEQKEEPIDLLTEAERQRLREVLRGAH